MRDYDDRYGAIAHQPISSWDEDFPREDITAEEFEEVWREARVTIEQAGGRNNLLS